MGTRSRATVSLCMIVRNEEHNLAACLEPVAPLVDEIVIVDTGSQDQTRDIASRFTPLVFDFEWCDDYAAARNESLRRSTGDWILWLDADDRVHSQDAARIAALFKTLDDQPRLYQMLSISSLPSGTAGVWQATQPRLFRRHPDLCWTGRVHEQLTPQPGALGYVWVPTDIEIHHIGYEDAAVCRRKTLRKLRLLRMDYTTNPDDPSTLFHLGMTAMELGDVAEARKHLLRLTEVAPAEVCYLGRVFSALAELLLGEEKPAEAIALVECGTRIFPADEHLLYLRALCLYRLGQLDAASGVLLQLMTAERTWQFQMGQPGQIRERVAPRALAEILGLQGAYGPSRALLNRVLSDFPHDLHAWYLWGLTCIAAQEQELFERILEKLGACPGGEVQAKLLRAIWHLRIGQVEPAGELLDDVIGQAPRLPFPRQLRVEWLSRSGAPVPSQIRAVRDVLRLQPWNAEAQGWLQQLEGIQVHTAVPPTVLSGHTDSIVAAAW